MIAGSLWRSATSLMCDWALNKCKLQSACSIFNWPPKKEQWKNQVRDAINSVWTDTLRNEEVNPEASQDQYMHC